MQIFFSELKYTHIDAEEAYVALSLMCDIGGALGLILGSTVLTLCEFTDFLFVITTAWVKGRAPAGVVEQ